MAKKTKGLGDWPAGNSLAHMQFTKYLHNPALWQFLNLSRPIALDIAKGFPEYWLLESESRGPAISQQVAETIAEQHRAERLTVLAQMDSPITGRFAFDRRASGERVYRKGEFPVQYVWPSSKDHKGPTYPNPFAVRLDGKEGEDYKTGKAVTSVAMWRFLACNLLLHAVHHREAPFCEEFLPQIGKQGKLPDGATYQGGSRLANQDLLEYASSRSGANTVRWGPLRYETQSVFDSHFCVVGKPRTGKTTILKLLFQSIHTDLEETTRFVFYDSKPDLLPFMTRPEDLDDSHASSELPFYLLSPFDKRSTAWDIAKDASSRTKAEDIADILFGVGSPNEDFFDAAAPTIAAAVMDALNRKAGDNWTFYDLISALRPENVEAILKSNPYGEQEYKTYLQSPTASSADLIKTLANKTKVLRPVAYAWTHAKDRLSLTDWVNSHTKSIVLANNDEYTKATTEINRILLNILSKQLLGKENPPARTFLYLDEFEHLGHISTLTRMAHQGASRKVNMALALHNLDTLKKVYQQDIEGILGDCAFKAFLSVEVPKSADWASLMLGEQQVVISQESIQSGSTTGQSTRKEDATTSESEQKGESVTRISKTRKLVSADEIRRLPLPVTSQEVTGYFMAPGHEPYQGTLPLSKLLCSKDEFLDRRDNKHEDNFYALWPKNNSISESDLHPPAHIDSPDDSFANLHALGFPKDGYPPAGQQTSASKPSKPEVNLPKNDAEPQQPTTSLDDLDYGFELEDE